MKLTATLRIPRFDMSKYRRALHEQLGEAITQAAFSWLGAATDAIPVWSGASHATFLPLASAIGFSMAVAPVNAGGSRVGLGLNNATGELIADASTGKFQFSYSTTLKHLIYNEFNNANISPDPSLFAKLHNPGPYDFQKKALEAYEKSIRNVGLPDPFKSLTVTQVRV